MSITPLATEGRDVHFVRYDDVALDRLMPSPHQPRKQLDALVIQSLKESILAVGVMQRPRVREVDGFFELVFGHQRAEAARQLGHATLAVEVVACDDMTARRMTLHENIKSTRLHPIEHAEAIVKFLDATLCSDDRYGLIQGETAQARIYRVLTILTKPPAEGDEDAPVRHFVLDKAELVTQVIREMANKEPKAFLTSDVTLLQLPEAIINATVELGLKKGHARALGELMNREPALYEQVMANGLPGDDNAWTPLGDAPVGKIRELYRPRKVELEPQESDAYQAYIPVGVPGARAEGAAASEVAASLPWEDTDNEALMPMFALPLASLQEAHAAITTLSAEEWAGLIQEANESARNDARRQWVNIRRWAEEVMHILG